MQRSRFLPLPGLGVAGRDAFRRGPRRAWPRSPRPGLEPAARAEPGRPSEPTLDAAGRPGPRGRRSRRGRGPEVRWLGFACPLAPGGGWPAARAVLDQVIRAVNPPGTVILDLAGSEGVAEDDCAALSWLHEALAGGDARLWLAGPPRPVAELLAGHGVTGWPGGATVFPSHRAAVLALFAALPGPGLVTSDVRAALAVPPQPLPLPGAAPPPAAGSQPTAVPLPLPFPAPASPH
jgi:hypothetical protein